MFRRVALLPIALMSACAGGCSIVRALYVAVVHNSGAPPHEEMVRIDEREREFLRTLSHRRVLILPVAVLGRRSGTTRRPRRRSPSSSARNISGSCLSARSDRAAVRAAAERGGDSLVALHGARRRTSRRIHERMSTTSCRWTCSARQNAAASGRCTSWRSLQQGEMAYRRLWNSHQPLYKEVQPRTLDDVVQMVVTDLSRRAAGPAH